MIPSTKLIRGSESVFRDLDTLVDQTLSFPPLPSLTCCFWGGNEVLHEDEQHVPEFLEVWQWGNAREDLSHYCLRWLCQE